MKKRYILFFIFLTSSMLQAQTDDVGSGRAIRFDGTDDYIDLGNVYDDLNFPVTLSAWVYVEPSTEYILPIFVTQDNAPIYNGLWFCLSNTNLFIEYGDGRGQQSSAFRRGKSASIPVLENRWIYVSAVIRSGNDIQLFTNGFNVGGSYTGDSGMPMSSDFPNDVAKIGYLHTNDVTHRFKGVIDEVRFWNRALTENEIRQGMSKKLSLSEPNLIGYWNFNEISGDTLKDLGPGRHHGIVKGHPERIYSGAAVGDESSFLYTSDWSSKSLSKNDLTVTQISGNPKGIQIYTVSQMPSQMGGVDSDAIQTPYYGIFLADNGETNTFDVSFQGSIECPLFSRADNSHSVWSSLEAMDDIEKRTEIIRVFEKQDLGVDLGADLTICDQDSQYLEAHQDPEAKSFRWSTGETSPGITIGASGSYTVRVTQTCKADADTINIAFEISPPEFSLGADEVLCAFERRALKPDLEHDDFEFVWQDGTRKKTFEADGFGTYWLKVENACGVSTDTITFTKEVFTNVETYNFISPGNRDGRNEFFIIDERLMGASLSVFNRWGKPVFESAGYQNTWDGDDLPSGVYYYTITNDCIEPLKGTLTIMR